jgi:hypothetical protein
VRDAVLLRAAGLSEEARAAVLAASVVGQVFDPELVTAVADLGEWPDELARHGVVRETDAGQLAFRHALVRDAFYGEVPWTRRLALHRAVAERLEAAGAPAAVVAEQWARGRAPDRARSSLMAAAEAFSAVHAYRDAARATGRALALWPEGHDEPGRLDALERLAGCAELAGDLGEAIGHWREVADGRQQLEDPSRLGAAYRRRPPWSCRAGGRRRWPRGSAAPSPSPLPMRRRTRPPSGSPPPRTCGRPPASGRRCACWRSPRRRRGPPAGSTCRRGCWGWRATSAPGWARAGTRSSWSAPA